MEYVTLSNGVEMPILGYGVYQVTQVFFHILILDALNYSVFAAIENRFPGDGTVTVLSLSALFFVDQMTILLRHNF